MKRRHVLIGTGTLLSATFAGCVEDSDPVSPAGDTEPKNDTDPSNDDSSDPTDDGPSNGDADVRSIDGRLHNETGERQTFQITITDDAGEQLLEGDSTVDPNTTRRLPGFGRPGATQTFEVTVGERSTTETLELDVERNEAALDGYVEIRFTEAETIEIELTPRSEIDFDRDVVTEAPRVDAPPHEIERPDPPDDPSEFDEWDGEYLGASMATEPSLAMTRYDVRPSIFADRGVTYEHGEAYWVEVIESMAKLDEVLGGDSAIPDELADVDFDDTLLVAVETGFGSGSIEHRWARAVDVSDGVHLHGYYTDPYEGTDDITTWGSVLAIDRPDDVEIARVSLTVDEERRVHFNSTEGVVTPAE